MVIAVLQVAIRRNVVLTLNAFSQVFSESADNRFEVKSAFFSVQGGSYSALVANRLAQPAAFSVCAHPVQLLSPQLLRKPSSTSKQGTSLA